MEILTNSSTSLRSGSPYIPFQRLKPFQSAAISFWFKGDTKATLRLQNGSNAIVNGIGTVKGISIPRIKVGPERMGAKCVEGCSEPAARGNPPGVMRLRDRSGPPEDWRIK
ncbi:BQ5605_C003g02408 [Microbotryum silenes-dioicae]|uniref:BQ5605_C003g02408 protein n=1 Tax=Microbotryum silenes-dioicae TaxID=796604 RepID=A0A2X0M1H3_9BASI|nr:BQ5605_C003g02408 [Microbotryum silenes-dioicae]